MQVRSEAAKAGLVAVERDDVSAGVAGYCGCGRDWKDEPMIPSLFAAVPIKVLVLLLPALLGQSAGEWGSVAPGVSISFSQRMGSCATSAGIAAWSDMYSHRIKLNSRCAWTEALLRIAVLHEYGHMLNGVAHSEDPESVMYFRLALGQKIQPADLRRVEAER